MISYYELNVIENFFGKVIFKIIVEIEMLRNENRSFVRNFETIFFFWGGYFLLEYGCFLVYKYIV